MFYKQTSAPGTFVTHFGRDPTRDFGIFAEAYRCAAANLAQNLLSQPRFPDYEAYPVVFLYRHALELYLKNIISKGISLAVLRDGPELRQKMIYNHNLTNLMSTSRDILRSLFPKDKSLSETLSKLETITKQLAELDPTSFVFRYPTDTLGERPCQSPIYVNLADFETTMNDVLEDLEIIDFGLDVETDKAEELRAILEQLCIE